MSETNPIFPFADRRCKIESVRIVPLFGSPPSPSLSLSLSLSHSHPDLTNFGRSSLVLISDFHSAKMIGCRVSRAALTALKSIPIYICVDHAWIRHTNICHFLVIFRFNRCGSVHGSFVSGKQWPGLCHFRHQRHPVPADPADASRRSPGRHVAAPGFGGFHTSSGKSMQIVESSFYFFSFLFFLF